MCTYSIVQSQLGQELHQHTLVSHTEIQRQILSIRLQRIKHIEPAQSIDAQLLVFKREFIKDLPA